MKSMTTVFCAALAGFLWLVGVAQAADVAVIVQSSNPEVLTLEQIKNIYSDRRTTWRSWEKMSSREFSNFSALSPRTMSLAPAHIVTTSGLQVIATGSSVSSIKPIRIPGTPKLYKYTFRARFFKLSRIL